MLAPGGKWTGRSPIRGAGFWPDGFGHRILAPGGRWTGRSQIRGAGSVIVCGGVDPLLCDGGDPLLFVWRRSVIVVCVVMAVLFVSMYVRRSISCQLVSLCVDHMSTYIRMYVIVSIQHDLMSIGVDLC